MSAGFLFRRHRLDENDTFCGGGRRRRRLIGTKWLLFFGLGPLFLIGASRVLLTSAASPLELLLFLFVFSVPFLFTPPHPHRTPIPALFFPPFLSFEPFVKRCVITYHQKAEMRM